MDVIKSRMIKLAEALSPKEADKVADHIEAMMGIQYVEVYEDRIEITYDLLEVMEFQMAKQKKLLSPARRGGECYKFCFISLN